MDAQSAELIRQHMETLAKLKASHDALVWAAQHALDIMQLRPGYENTCEILRDALAKAKQL